MFRVLLFTAAFLVGLEARPAFAQQTDALFCDAENFIFSCHGKIENNADVLEAMASLRTRTLLKASFANPDKFPIGDKREIYRLALEKRRKQMTRFADRSFVQYRRKKITEEDYAKLRIKYESAVENYRTALNVYRKGTWLSDEKRP